MGKRVLVSLLAVALIFLASRPGTAQDAQNPTPEEATEPVPKGFQPGSFLTQEDFEHIEAALGCINLTPKDLEYNKVLRDDAYRLKVCDQSLNDPLSVPRTAEDAAKAFSANSTPTWRSMKAGELLGLPHARWQPDELRKDGKYPDGIQRKIDDNWKKLDELGLEGVRELEKKVYAQFAEYLVGGTAKDLVVADEIGTKVFSSDPLVALMARIFPSLNAYARTVDQNSLVESRALGVWAPSMFEAPDTIPDAEGEFEDASPFDTAANVDLPGAFVSGCRLSMTLSDLSTQLLAAIRSAGSSDTSFVGLTTHDVEGVTGGVICAFDGPWGRVVVGGDGPNVYEGDDFVAIIDLGGDDTYRGRVASGIGYPGRPAISFVLDLAGDDRYLGDDFTQGFGFLGVGILHDLGGGDDVYKSRFCAQGCGLCGY
ncbi:MAG: hypothetical protein KDB32_06325, partial [Planctomycetes bacterium]|nr:hypothetical protein [Planctomycetota bacterium]